MVLSDKILDIFIYFLFSKQRQHTKRRFLIGVNAALRSVPRLLMIWKVLYSEITIWTKLGIIMI